MTNSRHEHDSSFLIWWREYFVLPTLPSAGIGVSKSIDTPATNRTHQIFVPWSESVFVYALTLPWPDRSNSISPFSVPISKLTPHRAAHRISELNRFLYFRISGVSLVMSCDVGVTFTLTWLSRRDGPEPPAPNPNVKKLRCFCCKAYACGGNNCCEEDEKLLFLFSADEDGDDDKFINLLWLGIFGWEMCCCCILLTSCLVGVDGFDNVELGDDGFKINDLDGVEWTELTAARYCQREIGEKKRRRKKKREKKNFEFVFLSKWKCYRRMK